MPFSGSSHSAGGTSLGSSPVPQPRKIVQFRLQMNPIGAQRLIQGMLFPLVTWSRLSRGSARSRRASRGYWIAVFFGESWDMAPTSAGVSQIRDSSAWQVSSKLGYKALRQECQGNRPSPKAPKRMGEPPPGKGGFLQKMLGITWSYYSHSTSLVGSGYGHFLRSQLNHPGSASASLA